MSDEEISAGEGGPLPYERAGEPPETADDDTGLGPPWTRRTFLKAAALGTAAAAMYEGVTLFAPLAAYADDLSGLNCTANDVRIPTPGVVLNEPCTCSGTFDAEVQFRIINNTGTNRYCVTVHFCPIKLSDGSTFSPGDIVIGDIPAGFDGLKTVTIKKYPCGQGKLCFGECGPGTDPTTGQPDCSFPKGTDCPAGKCCTTITWNVKASDPCPDTTRQISSKCRHQQVCIQGRGVTTIDCGNGAGQDCKVSCGAKTTVTVCTTNASSLGPFKYELKGTDGTSLSATDAATCHAFEVGPITADTTFTGTVTDKDGCAKSASLKITTTQLTVAIKVTGDTNCNGLLTFSAPDPSGFSGCKPAWTIDGNAAADTNLTDPTKDPYVKVNADGTLTYRNLDGKCHTIGVTLTCGNCFGTASQPVTQCVTTDLKTACS